MSISIRELRDLIKTAEEREKALYEYRQVMSSPPTYEEHEILRDLEYSLKRINNILLKVEGDN